MPGGSLERTFPIHAIPCSLYFSVFLKQRGLLSIATQICRVMLAVVDFGQGVEISTADLCTVREVASSVLHRGKSLDVLDLQLRPVELQYFLL